MKRTLFVAGLSAGVLAGCTTEQKQALTDTLRGQLGSVQALNHALIGTRGAARLYTEADIDRTFRVNSLPTPADARYLRALGDGGRGFRLPITGLVERPQTYTLAELRAMPQLTQITRHDCVEGWSQVGKWSGVPLATIVATAQPKPAARYVIFRCFDADAYGSEYYESLDLHQAAHPQTLLALDLNDAPLAPDHGAPVRLRVPTQLGYKSAKWVRAIELAAAFQPDSQGGYWEDNGYQWYAGI